MGANHMAEQLRNWSPGRAVLPPDPGGLNRALDRVAAEHLREVAPHLAPCLSCQAGLCAEHGPTVTATTTGERDGITSEPRLLLAVPIPPAPPQLDKFRDLKLPCPGCGAPLPAGTHHVCHAPPVPPAEAKGEMSREDFAKHGSAMLLLVLQDARPRYDEFVRHFNAIAECDAGLRTRAREAESFGAHWIARAATVLRERDEAREQRDALSRENKGLRDQRDDLTTALAAAKRGAR